MMDTAAYMNSGVMYGNVRHRRFSPIEHSLNAQLFMPYRVLDVVDILEYKVWGFGAKGWHWARFKRSDYVGDGDLKLAVVNKAIELGAMGISHDCKVFALIHLRYLGLYFSPVNFYYLHDEEGEWRYLLAEVSNTPWNETHYYLVPTSEGLVKEFEHDKAFHVSPFNPVTQSYHWKAKKSLSSLLVHLECHKESKVFDATLSFRKKSFTTTTLITQLIKTPIMAVKVLLGIYWHAFILWRKGAPVYDHPNKQKNEE
jgi:DUF1365 family protein